MAARNVPRGTLPIVRGVAERYRRGNIVANPGRATTPPPLMPDYDYVYTVTEFKSWTSWKGGSVTEDRGTYDSILAANEGIDAVYERLRGGTEEDGWSMGEWDDGRHWYNCDDWGHEERYQLRIKAKPIKRTVVRRPRPRSPSDEPPQQPGSSNNNPSSRAQSANIPTVQSRPQSLEALLASDERIRNAFVRKYLLNSMYRQEVLDALLKTRPYIFTTSLLTEHRNEAQEALLASEHGVRFVTQQLMSIERRRKALGEALLASEAGRREIASVLLNDNNFEEVRGAVIAALANNEDVLEEAKQQATENNQEQWEAEVKEALREELEEEVRAQSRADILAEEEVEFENATPPAASSSRAISSKAAAKPKGVTKKTRRGRR